MSRISGSRKNEEIEMPRALSRKFTDAIIEMIMHLECFMFHNFLCLRGVMNETAPSNQSCDLFFLLLGPTKPVAS